MGHIQICVKYGGKGSLCFLRRRKLGHFADLNEVAAKTHKLSRNALFSTLWYTEFTSVFFGILKTTLNF